METPKTEIQQKTEALANYIEKKLTAGTSPKELYLELIENKVPSHIAVELIEKSLQQRQTQTSVAPAAIDPKTARQQKIKNFIAAQLDAGKSPQEILKILVDKNVPREEAIDLIKQVAKPTAPTPPTPQPPAERSVSPELPGASISTPHGVQNSPAAFVAAQLDQGMEMKAIVDQLEAEGMPRNQAIDLVVGLNEKQKTELVEPGMANRAELARKGRNRMLIGLAALVGGGLITIASYSAADPGGTYFLFYGPMIYGAIAGVSGFIQWMKHM